MYSSSRLHGPKEILYAREEGKVLAPFQKLHIVPYERQSNIPDRLVILVPLASYCLTARGEK